VESFSPFELEACAKKQRKLFLVEDAFKSEARNPKFEAISNDRNTKFKTVLFWKFGNLKLGFVSDWSETDASPDIRISDLSKDRTSSAPPMPG
jgi:hypothetical protein